jgi:hypothetical protein
MNLKKREPELTQGPADLVKLVGLLRKRSRRLRRNALFSLFLIIAALGTGLYLFIYAGSISARDLDYAAELRARRQEYEMEQLLSRLADTKTGAGDTGLTRDLLSNYLKLDSRISAVEQKPSADSSKTQLFASTITTRLGSVLILLFLVQILVTLYRYNMRLAAFYDGRADALILITSGDDFEFSKYSDFITPTNLDFGKLPATPFSHAMEAAKEIVKTKMP